MPSNQVPFCSGEALQRRAHRELIAARLNLKRHDQAVPPGIPVKSKIRVVDIHADTVDFAIGDRAGIAINCPCTNCGVPSAETSARILADRGRSISTSLALSRIANMISRVETLRASMPTARMPSAIGRIAALSTQGRLGLSDSSRKTTPPWRGRVETRVDPVKCPPLPVAPVVDDKISIFETELAQVMAVEACLTDGIEPGHHARNIFKLRAERPLRRRVRARPAWSNRSDGRRGRRDRPSVGAGENGQPSVGLNSYRHLRADEIEALSAQLSHQQTSARQANFRLRRARDDCPVGIAYDDVAQAKRRAAPFVALELSTADLDTVVAAEIFLDRRLEPRRGDIKCDGSAGQPPPEAEHDHGRECPADRKTPKQTPHEGRTKPADCPVPQIVPASAAEGACYPPAMRRVAHSDSVGAMAVLVLAPCHASGRAPRLTLAT